MPARGELWQHLPNHQNGLECLVDKNEAQSANRTKPSTDLAKALGVLRRAAAATKATSTITPNQGMGENTVLCVMGFALFQQPSPRSEPNQDFLQIVQTGINNHHEYNGQSNNAHGPFGRRSLQNLGQVGQRIFELATAQRLSRRQAASPNPTSTRSELTHPNKRRSVWHAPLQKCVLRAGTKSPARS